MKKIFFLSFLLCNAILLSAQSITGEWKTIDDETGDPKSVVKVYEYDGKVYGKIVRLFRTPEEDQDPTCKECKGAKKGQKIIGMEIMEGLVKDGDEYDDGTILDPDNGKVYDCKIWLEDGKLQVRGYIGPFYRTQEWVKAE